MLRHSIGDDSSRSTWRYEHKLRISFGGWTDGDLDLGDTDSGTARADISVRYNRTGRLPLTDYLFTQGIKKNGEERWTRFDLSFDDDSVYSFDPKDPTEGQALEPLKGRHGFVFRFS